MGGAGAGFATAVSPAFRPGACGSLFYVGKAGGPLIEAVGIRNDQEQSGAAVVAWMLERRNPSAFWRFADLLSPHRECIAWSNVAKIDTKTAAAPGPREWSQIREACIRALREELETLRPARAVFAISDYRRREVAYLLEEMGYLRHVPERQLEWTDAFVSPDHHLAIITRHPQGWQSGPRDRVADFVRSWQIAQR